MHRIVVSSASRSRLEVSSDRSRSAKKVDVLQGTAFMSRDTLRNDSAWAFQALVKASETSPVPAKVSMDRHINITRFLI